MTTANWPEKGPRPARAIIKDLEALREAREGGTRWHGRFANMGRAERADALGTLFGVYNQREDENYKPAISNMLALARGDRESVAEAARARREGGTPALDEFTYERRVNELRDMARAVLGPHYGTDKYPEYRPWTDALDVLAGRRGELRPVGPVELSPQEEAVQALPAGLQHPMRAAMRGTRSFLTAGADALRAFARAAGSEEDARTLGGFIGRQARMAALDQAADEARYRASERNGAPGWLTGAQSFAEDIAGQGVGLWMSALAYGSGLPAVFGVGAGQSAYDDAKARGYGTADALAQGLLYGGADTAIWMAPGLGMGRAARLGNPVARAAAVQSARMGSLGAKGVGSWALGNAWFGRDREPERREFWEASPSAEVRQDWGGGDAMAQMDELARPEYSVMRDWGEWAGQDATVRPEPTWRTVTLRGRVLPENGTARDDFPYEFDQGGTISPEGVPYVALDPGEVNANARDLGDGTAVTTAGADLFSLSERERAEFDRLTKEGVNPRDRRVRMLRAMLAAGERSRDDVKALAWAERKNRDIATAKDVARAEEGKADNWQDYYVPTSAGMTAAGVRSAVAEDIGRHADWLRGKYERREGAGDRRGSERAMDDLKAFRKKAQYLARRYGLHPELAKLSGDRTLWSMVSGGQEGQRLSVRGSYPQDLYVETGHYLTDPSPLTRERDYVMARRLLDGIDDYEVADELKTWADRYRDRTRRWSVWNMPFGEGDWADELNGNFVVPVDGTGNPLSPAPEWLTRHAKRRKKRR